MRDGDRRDHHRPHRESPGDFPTDRLFARHTGTAPVPASSGNTQRHRLHRGGDGQLNHAITSSRSAAPTDPEIRTYLARKHAEGKTKLEAIRCLKRHLARRTWRLLYTAETCAVPPILTNRSTPEIPKLTRRCLPGRGS